MDSKVLYTNEDADIQCVAVKSIETVKCASASSSQQRTPLTSSTDAVLFLLPREILYAYMYIGAADGTLLALRFQVILKELTVPGGGRTYEHRVALEAQSKVVIPAPTSSMGAADSKASRTRVRAGEGNASEKVAVNMTDSSIASMVRGVCAMDAPASLPYLFVLVHGRFQVHEDDTLQFHDPAYTAGLELDDSTVLLMCTGEEQDPVSRQRRPSASSLHQGHEGAPLAAPVAYYALLLDSWKVVLVECTKPSSARLAFLDGTAEAFGWSNDDVEGVLHASTSAMQRRTPVANTLLSVRPGTSTMAWCGDVLITGSPEYYCLYDTLHGSLLSQLEVGGLLGGCVPYAAYIRGASVDPSRVGFALATDAAEVCSCSSVSSARSRSSGGSSSSSTGSSTSGSDTSLDSRGDSASIGSAESDAGDAAVRGRRQRHNAAVTTGWPSALVFALRKGELHVCAGAGATDLTAAAPLAAAFGEVCAVHSCPPFLLCQRGGCAEEEACSVSPSPSSSSRIRASLAELRRASQQLSARLSESRRPAKLCEMVVFSCLDGQQWPSPQMEPVSFMSVNLCGVRAFPLGLLGVSRHMVEALLWKPFAVQLEDQVESGHYARVLRFVSQCFRGSEELRRGVLRRVCQASAAQAMSRHRYRVAFYFYTLAGAGVESLLRLFPELQRPAAALHRERGNAGRGGRNKDSTSFPQEVGSSTRAGSLGAASDAEGDESFRENATRQFSYASHAPYRALFRILLSQFFALVASAAGTSVGSPADVVGTKSEGPRTPASPVGAAAAAAAASSRSGGKSPAQSAEEPSTAPASVPVSPAAPAAPRTSTWSTADAAALVSDSQAATPTPTQRATPNPSYPGSPLQGHLGTLPATPADTRANIEFALFCLFAIDCAGARRVRSTRDELLQFMVSVQTLHPGDCTAVLTALGLPPQALLTTMLLATTGDYDQALSRCQEEGDVVAAGATLALKARTPDTTMAQLDRLYQLHLPWMLEVDPPTAVQLLTTPAKFVGERPGLTVLLPVLLTIGGTVLLDYLSYLINTECSVDPVVHQLYATHLVRTLHTLRDEWGLQGFASAELGAADGAGAETGLVGHIRRALLSFLQWSPYYDKERVLAILIESDLYEEQCVVLEALDDHIGVLTVLVYAMKDMNRAVSYCEAHYTQDRADVHRWLPLADLLDNHPAELPASRPASKPTEDKTQQRGTAWASTAGGATGGPAPSRAATETFRGAVDIPLFPSRDCRRLMVNEAAAMAHYTHEASLATSSGDGDALVAVAPSHVPVWHPIMRFNQYLHMLLHVLLVPPTGSAIALPEIVWLLSVHSPFMSPRLVLSSLPGDLPMSHIAPYLIRAFQRLELNHQLVRMESAAVQSTLADAVRRHLTLQQRCVWMGEQRRCVVCGALLERGGLIVVFPNLKPAHFRCHQDGTLDPERAVPFLSNVA